MEEYDDDVDGFPGRVTGVEESFKLVGNAPGDNEVFDRLAAMDSLERKQANDEEGIKRETTEPDAIRESVEVDPLSDDVANTMSFGYAAAAFVLTLGYLLSSA